MISSEPIDGSCFLMTVYYNKSAADFLENKEPEQHKMWGEGIPELFRYYLETEHIWPIILRIEISDDSK
jgi:hypothetical protein